MTIPSIQLGQSGQRLPSGTVTFLFTDIEGSTQLARQFSTAWPAIQAQHHTLVRDAIAAHQGHVFHKVGDEFHVAFESALDALGGAVDAQRALQENAWDGAGKLRVRMGLHTGPATPQADDYEGYLTLSHTKRLMSAAHGGQILVSQATEAVLRDTLPEEVGLRALGAHRLKDFERAEPIFQVITPGLPTDFPPPETLAGFPNNLPAQLTSFIGREGELAEAEQLLLNTRLLTFTGPGGTGKTRLSLQLAAKVLTDFNDGAWLVELASLTDPTLIAQTVAITLSVRDQPGRTVLEALTDYLRAKKLLLILDNCEHLVDASAKLADHLLRAAPGLQILVSSREALGIGGETTYRVPSLPLPERVGLAELAENECVRLFLDRAGAARPGFCLTEGNATAIVDICRRLDGIPLAIELAAARTRVFSPKQIAGRLDDRFRLLTGGSRAALERHQTLQALVDWSYELLPEQECLLLTRLSVFAGGWTLEAAEAVCGERLGDEVLDLLTHLVDKSLVMPEEKAGEARHRFLETIRQYARDKLFESGEGQRMRDRHLEYFLSLAERAEPKLRSGEQLEWLERLEVEYDNLRAALAWSLESSRSNQALRLAGALTYFWELRGLSEGCKWLDDALALPEREQGRKAPEGEFHTPTRAQSAQRAKALYGSGRIRIMTLLDRSGSRTLVEESLRLWRELGDKWWMAMALENLGFLSNMEGNIPMGRAQLEESVSLAREVGDPWLLALGLERLAGVVERTDAASGHQIREEGVALARKVGDRSVLSEGLGDLAPFYLLEGNLTTAAALVEEALAAAREIGDLVHIEISLVYLAFVLCLRGDTVMAKGCCFEALAFAQEKGASQWAMLAVLGFATVAIFSGQAVRGARLFGAVDTQARQHGIDLLQLEAGEREPDFMLLRQPIQRAQAQLGPTAFQAAWAEGQRMTLEQALALATEEKT